MRRWRCPGCGELLAEGRLIQGGLGAALGRGRAWEGGMRGKPGASRRAWKPRGGQAASVGAERSRAINHWWRPCGHCGTLAGRGGGWSGWALGCGRSSVLHDP